MAAIRAFWAKNLLNKLVLVSVVGLLCCCGLAAVGSRGQRTASTGGGQLAAAEPTDVPAATEGPAPTEGPTETPAPTDTPAPTETPAPTNTPEPTATPVPPVELSGSGQTVTEALLPPSRVNRVSFTHQGRRNFIVRVYKSDGSDDLMVNAVGAYEGTRPLFVEGEVYFEIDADGPWTVRVEAIAGDQEAALGAEGIGDYVSGLFVPPQSGPVPFEVAHNGQRNFIVYLHCASGTQLVQNELGAVSGSTVVRIGEGPCLWEVQADGGWAFRPRP